MEKTVLFSVIIPIYNMELWLKRCLNSVVDQTYRDLEIILIDDGSSDSSPEIIRDYAKRDARIRVITKRNERIGPAVSDGLAAASGNYISFVDSDDYCDIRMYEALAARIRETGADIVHFGIRRFDEAGRTIRIELPDFDLVEGNEAVVKMHFEKIRNPGMACRVYRRELFDGVEIPRQNTGVDELLTPQVLMRAESICAVREPFYQLFVRSTSVSRATLLSSSENLFPIYNRILAITKEKNTAVYRYIIIKYLNYSDAVGLEIFRKDSRKNAKSFLIERCRCQEFIQELKGSQEWKSAGRKFRLRMYLLLKHCSLYYTFRTVKIKLGKKYKY